MCNASFSYKQRLETHISSIHEGKKPYECPICNEKYAHRGGMVKHIAAEHKKITYDCKICKVSFKNKQSLEKHIEKCQKVL